jgi:hypothetical protein
MLPHSQTNRMPLAFHAIMAGAALLLIMAMVSIGGTDGLGPVILGLGLIFGLSFVFSKLHIEISSTGIQWHFRWKLSGGFIPVTDIREAEITYMGWHMGYGHRWTRRGTLYRAWGLDVVQIHRQNGKPVFIGASDAPGIVKAIEKMQEEWLEMTNQ